MPTSSRDHVSSIHVAVALEGAGWHPAAWREPDARPDELFGAPYWVGLTRAAEAASLDFVTIEDGLGLQSSRWEGPDHRTDQVRGRLDAVLIASRVAPTTSAIGLVPTATTTHTEPFHVAKAVATLDFVSAGRAGWRAQVSSRGAEARHFGRRTLPSFRPGASGSADPSIRQVVADLFAETDDFIEVTRRLWDSWEDDAEIRDQSTGRFVDREKLHYIDFEGRWFWVRGPSITPRPPQGQPLIAVLGHVEVAFQLAARQADVVFVTPHDRKEAQRLVEMLRHEEAALAREAPLRIFADLVVFVDRSSATAVARRDRLDELDGQTLRSDAKIVVGNPTELADLLMDWRETGIEGFRLRPGVLPHDLLAITEQVIPLLRRRGVFRTEYEEVTLRERLGLARPANRYAVA